MARLLTGYKAFGFEPLFSTLVLIDLGKPATGVIRTFSALFSLKYEHFGISTRSLHSFPCQGTIWDSFYYHSVVRVLDETHTPVPRTALATYVAKERFPPDTGNNFIRFQDKLLMKLYHIHLPLLSDVEIIDIENGIVTKGDTFGEALTLLDEIH